LKFISGLNVTGEEIMTLQRFQAKLMGAKSIRHDAITAGTCNRNASTVAHFFLDFLILQAKIGAGNSACKAAAEY